jgi:hypothetical protein
VDRRPREFAFEEVEKLRANALSTEPGGDEQREELRVAITQGERVIGPNLDAHKRVADHRFRLRREDQESRLGSQSVQIERPATFPRQHVVLDERDGSRQAVVAMEL